MLNRKTLSLGAAALVLAAGLFILPALFGPTPARAEPAKSAIEDIRGRTQQTAASQHIRVIDGDTLEDMSADITYRLVNIDTPETGSRAHCAAERELGNEATRAARALIAAAQNFETRPTGRVDRYGRTIAFILVDGRDLGETLIAGGLARPWRGRREPWCDASGNLIP